MTTSLWQTTTLQLTSPHMRDGLKQFRGHTLIKDTQYLLNGAGINKRTGKPWGDYYKANLDGEYGIASAAAVEELKWIMGYPKAQVNKVCGPKFQAFLRGEKVIPTLYLKRRELRLKQMAEENTKRKKALAKAKTYVGLKESPPYSNHTLFSDWWGYNAAWCGMFVSYNEVFAGSPYFSRGNFSAYVPFIHMEAVHRQHGLSLTSNPISGDLVTYKLGTFWPGHVGFFDEWGDSAHSWFWAVEGNTSQSSDDNGGEVQRRQRYRSQVYSFVRVSEG